MIYHPHIFPLFGQVQRCLSLTHTHKHKHTHRNSMLLYHFYNTYTMWQVLQIVNGVCTFMFCASTLALASSNRLITVVFPARTAQCSAVFLWYLSPRFTETLNVNNKRVGSTLNKKWFILFFKMRNKEEIACMPTCKHTNTRSYTRTCVCDMLPTSEESFHSDPSYQHPAKGRQKQ